MKRILSVLLVLCIVLSLCPHASASEASVQTLQEHPSVLVQEDYASADAVWQSIREKEAQLSQKKATRRQTVEAVISLVETSAGYEEGSLERHEDCFTWKTTEGVACLYPYEAESDDRGPSSGTPIVPPEDNYEHISYAEKGSPAGLDVYLIGPYYGVESDFTDHYKTVAQSVASAVGGTYTLYSYTAATIDNVANAVSNGSLVLVDSHGTTYTLNSRTRSYLRLQTSAGLTDWDYDNGFAYYTGSSYIVTGEAISAHMTKDAPNSFIWFGICSGMRYDTMCHPLIARGVEGCIGYSRTVSFEYDRLWLSAFCNAIKSGKTAAQAFSAMQSSVGKWDWYNEESYTYALAISNDEAFPVMVSAQDDYPTSLQAVQSVSSAWKLSACTHPSVSYVPQVHAGCISTGNIAHYYCAACNGHYSTAACTTRLSASEYLTEAHGHSICSGMCSNCGYTAGLLWHFWEHGEESGYRWIPKNFEVGTVTRTDTSDRGYLYSTTDGGDHYIYMRRELDGMAYTVASGDIVELRYRTVNLPSAKVGTTGSFEFWYSTSDANASFGTTLTASVSRKENEWQTVTFTPTAGVTIERVLFDCFEDDGGYDGARFEIDYLYIGQPSGSPGTRTETTLFFDFTNDNAASGRYVSEVYGDINYDRGFWAGNASLVHTVSYNDSNLSFLTADGATSVYLQTSDGTGSLSAMPLCYTPQSNDIIQIRLKIENLQAVSGATPYLRLYYGKDGSGEIAATDYTTVAELDDEALSGKYVTLIAPLEDSFTAASVIHSIRPQFGNLTNTSGAVGRITVDYIYVGAASSVPDGLGHEHSYGEDGLCTVCGRAHEHGFSDSYTAIYRAATCTAPGTASTICAECGESAWVSIPRTAHSYQNNVCTVCGYANGGHLIHFAANTPSADYTWNTYDGTTSVSTTDIGILSTVLASDASDHYMTLVEEIGYAVQSGDVIEIRFRCDAARTGAQSFELKYTTVTGQEAFSSNTTAMTESVSFAADTWSTVQFTPTAGQTVYRLFLEPFLDDDTSFRGKTFQIDYIYLGPADGAPSAEHTTAPLYFDFTNDTRAQHRFVSHTYGYLQTLESDVTHWVVNSGRVSKSIENGTLKLTVQSLGSPYAQIAKASGSSAYADAPLSYVLDGTDYAQICVKFDNCAVLSESTDATVYLYYLTDKTLEHENPSDQTTYNYGAKLPIDPAHLTDGQYHVYTIALNSAKTVGETLISFRLGFNNVAMASSGTSEITVDYLAIGAQSELPVTELCTVTFTDGEGTTLKTQTVAKGEPAYYGASVSKTADDSCHYIFSGWDKTLSAVTTNTTCNAIFAAEEHTKSDGVVTAATCTSDGYTTYTCSVCAVSFQADYVQGQHVPVVVNECEATCSQEGYTGDTVCQTCSVVLFCGETIAASGHNYELSSVAIEPTCTEEGLARYICQNCADSYSQTLSALGHSYLSTVTGATCTTAGFTTHVCSRCSDSYVDAHISALGHAYDIAVIEPTCTEGGYTTYTCTGCGESYVAMPVSALSHSYVYTAGEDGTHTISCTRACGYRVSETCSYTDGVCVCGAAEPCLHENTAQNVITAATCTEDGSALLVCTDCGKELETTVLSATGHDIAEVAEQAATCTQTGCRKHWLCPHCGVRFADSLGEYPLPDSYFEIAATGHTVVYLQEQDATCTADGYVRRYLCTVCRTCFFDAECEYEAPEEFLRIAATGHNYVDGVCTYCGESETAEPAYNSALSLTMNISVGAEMQVMYTILNSKVKNYDSFYVEVVKDVVGSDSVTTTFSINNSNLTEVATSAGTVVGYTATYTGIFAMEMGDNFTATLYAVDADGNVFYGDSVTASIKSYLMEKLADSTSSDELKTLAVDMLNYGAAAQVNFSYDTENLVNADLTDEQKALGTQETPSATDSAAASGDASKITTSVSLQSKVLLYVNCAYAKSDDSNLEFVVKNASTGEELERFAPTIAMAKICQGIYGNVGARQMRDLITVELYDNGELVSQTLTWSIESYVAQVRADSSISEALIATVNAMLTYGDSAAAYLTASGQ